jgi:hypothetical protein
VYVMNKTLILGILVIIASLGAGIFIGQRLFAKNMADQAIYEQAAIKVVDALQDEAFLDELASFARETQGPTKRFIFAVLKNLDISQEQFVQLQTCAKQYTELHDLFDDVNYDAVKKAWQGVAWEIVDGQIVLVHASLNAAGKKVMGLDPIIAPRVKRYAMLNAQWGHLVIQTVTQVDQMIAEQKKEVLNAYINFNASLYRLLKKYPKIVSVVYEVHACMQWHHTRQLFLLALKDQLISRMDQWLPTAWPYAKTGIQELGSIFDFMISKHIAYAEMRSKKAALQ